MNVLILIRKIKSPLLAMSALFYLTTLTAFPQQKPELYVATGHTATVEKILFSPDGRLMVTFGYYTVKVWDVGTGEELRTLIDPGGDHINAISFSPDGRTLATSHNKAGIRRWDIFTGKFLGILCGPQMCTSARTHG